MLCERLMESVQCVPDTSCPSTSDLLQTCYNHCFHTTSTTMTIDQDTKSSCSTSASKCPTTSTASSRCELHRTKAFQNQNCDTPARSCGQNVSADPCLDQNSQNSFDSTNGTNTSPSKPLSSVTTFPLLKRRVNAAQKRLQRPSRLSDDSGSDLGLSSSRLVPQASSLSLDLSKLFIPEKPEGGDAGDVFLRRIGSTPDTAAACFTPPPVKRAKLHSFPAATTGPAANPTSSNAYPAKIVPHLFLGNASCSTNEYLLKSLGIRYILNVTPNLPNHFEEDTSYRYLQIPALDHWSQDLMPYFKDAISFIEEARMRGAGVLVHCLAGISRSVTMVVAYLMSSCHLTLDSAFDVVKRAKSNIAPNFHFMGQLLEFERQLRRNHQHTRTTSESIATQRQHEQPEQQQRQHCEKTMLELVTR